MKLSRWLISSWALLVFSASCATMNADQCRVADWMAIGRTDAEQGRSSSRMADHSQACSKHGISVNSAEYKKGYNEGATLYCTPEKGYQLGKSGRMLQTIRIDCPSELAAGFQKGLQKGWDEYAAAVAAQVELQQQKAQEQKAKDIAQAQSAFVAIDSRGGACDASKTFGFCYLFSGAIYGDATSEKELDKMCKSVRGQFKPRERCPQENALGRCSLVKGDPGEFYLFYYSKRIFNLDSARSDCTDPKSKFHSNQIGEWAIYPQ